MSSEDSEKNKDDVKKEKEHGGDSADPVLKDSVPMTEKTIRKVNILDILSSLREIITASSNVKTECPDYGTLGYGPNEWSVTVKDRVVSRYRVIPIGINRVPYVIREPYISVDFSTIDEYILSRIETVHRVFENVLSISKEPPTTRILDRQIADPEDAGLPINELMATNIDPDIIRGRIMPYSSPIRQPENPNYSRGYQFDGFDLEAVRIDAFNLISRTMPPLKDTIEEEINRVLDGVAPVTKPIVTSNNHLYHLTANPFELNEMFTYMARPLHFSTMMINETLKPEISLTPLDPSLMQKITNVSMTRASSITNIINRDYTPDMANAISGYLLHLLSPGMFQFDIDLSDIPKSDHPTRMFCAMASKALFMHSDNNRWNGLTLGSVRYMDQVIAESLVLCETVTRQIAQQGEPLMGLAFLPRVNLDGFNGLITNHHGIGWREGNHQRYSDGDNTNYVSCQRRPLYVTAIDDINRLDSEDESISYGQWRIAASICSVLSGCGRHGANKGDYSGMSSVMRTLLPRVHRFFIVMNDFLRVNWYSGLRLNEQSMNGVFQDGTEEPVIVKIDGKTIIYLTKSLSEETKIIRGAPYEVQLRAEIGLSRDCVERAIALHIFNALVLDLNLPDDIFTSSEIHRLVSPRAGPLGKHTAFLGECGLLALLGDYSAFVINSELFQVLRQCSDLVLQNPTDFGILPEIRLSFVSADRSIDRLTALANDSIPYTNIGLFDQLILPEVNPVRPLVLLEFNAIPRLIETYRLQYHINNSSRNNVIALQIPIPYTISQEATISCSHERILNVNYPENHRRSNNPRFLLSWNKFRVNIVDIDIQKLQHPDKYIPNFSLFETSSISDEIGRQIFIRAEDWITRLHLEASPCMFVRTENVKLHSILDRV